MKLLMLAVAACLLCAQANGALGPSEDVPMGALPADTVKGIVQKTLSPQGRFVILASTGNVRIFDAPENIAQAKQALQAAQNAPALISFAFVIKTGMHKVTKVSSSGPAAEFPVPATYAPPQIVSTGRGYAVIPATPTSFTMEPVGVQETVTQTVIEGGEARRYAGATVFPKPVTVTISAKAADPASLHDWAVKNGSAPQNEPAWTAARTEILVTPEHADNGMVLNLQPQVVATGPDGSTHVVPLKTCTASVVVKQGATVTFDGFPGADADFYRLFGGADESTGDAISSVSVAAAFDYGFAAKQVAAPASNPAVAPEPAAPQAPRK